MSQTGKYISNNGPGGFIQTITGNAGPAIFPTAGNVNILGVNNITTTGVSPSTLDISVTGTTQHSLLLGNATGSINNLGVATNGQLPIGSTGADPVLATITAGNNIGITNGTGSITAAVTGTSNHQIQIGNASGSLTSLGAATNGQIPIGSTGADPVLSTITAGTGISVTNGAGSITIANTAASVAGTQSFAYYLASTTGGVTGNSANYTILFDTALVASANYNTGTGTFTAPATGTYFFQTVVAMTNISAAMTYAQLQMATSAHAYTVVEQNPFATATVAVGQQWCNSASIVAPMTINDTLQIQILILGGAANSAQVQGSAGGGTVFSMISGYRIA